MRVTKKVGFGSLAAVSAAALVLGLSSAPAMAAVKPTYEGVTLSSPGTIKTPSGYTATNKTVIVTINGPAISSNNHYYGYLQNPGPSVTPLKWNSRVKTQYVSKPSYSSSSTLDPALNNAGSLRVSSYTTPGRYRLAVPVTRSQSGTVTVKTGTVDFTVTATGATSKARSYWPSSVFGRIGKTAKLRASFPDYLAGAKLRTYVKLKGKKKYKKVSTTTVRASGSLAKATIKIPGRYFKKGAKFYTKVGSVPYASGYKGPTYRLKKK